VRSVLLLGVLTATAPASAQVPESLQEPLRTWVWGDPVVLGPKTPEPMNHPEAEWIIFMNRDGGAYTRGGDDARSNSTSIGTGNIPAYGGSDEQWQQVMECVQNLYADFNVHVTDVEPSPDRVYLESVVGGGPESLGLWGGVGGIAPFFCAPIAYAIVFTFSDVYGSDPTQSCTTAGQETAHALGLDHETECDDIMTYLPDCGEKAFQDRDASCGEWGPRPCTCGGDTQNSYRQLLATLGPHELPPGPRPLGLPCVGDGECESDYCLILDGAEGVCSQECDFTTPGLGCAPGFVCLDQSCGEGACVLGNLGVTANGRECADSAQCASGLCAGGTCASPCDPGNDQCAGKGVCQEIDEGCGACEGGPEDLPNGSPCTDGGVCASGICGGMDDEEHYCTNRCASQEECLDAGYRCEGGYCYLEGDGTLGTPCIEDTECVSGVCSNQGFCTQPCDDEAHGCPEGFTCRITSDGDYCVPLEGQLPFGQDCTDDADCLSEACRDGQCSRPCTDGPPSPCPPGHECIEEEDALLCEPTASYDLFEPGGCGCRVPGGEAPIALAFLGLAFLPLAMRRRRG